MQTCLRVQRHAVETISAQKKVIEAQQKNLVAYANLVRGHIAVDPSILENAVHVTDHTFISDTRAYGVNVFHARIHDHCLSDYPQWAETLFRECDNKIRFELDQKVQGHCDAKDVWVVMRRPALAHGEWDSSMLATY